MSPMEILTKICTKCGVEKPATGKYFDKQKRGKYGLKARCKKCISEYSKQHQKEYYSDNKDKIKRYQKEYHITNKDKVSKRKKNWRECNKEKVNQQKRLWYLKSSYGLTEKQYDKIYKDQHGLCAMCGKPETLIIRGKLSKLGVDHNHKTGKVRGLLCSRCNLIVGAVEKHQESVNKYLKKYEEL